MPKVCAGSGTKRNGWKLICDVVRPASGATVHLGNRKPVADRPFDRSERDEPDGESPVAITVRIIPIWEETNGARRSSTNLSQVCLFSGMFRCNVHFAGSSNLCHTVSIIFYITDGPWEPSV